jgi:DNA polymerase-3 subunit beta
MTQALQRSRGKTAKQKKQTGQPTSEAAIAQRTPRKLASLEQPTDTTEASEAETTVDEPENSAEPEVSAAPMPKKSARKRAARSQPKDTPATEQGMQVICSQSQFHDALAIASCAAPAKPSHPVLANVLVVADANAQQVHLTVTDLAMTIQASFEAQVLLGSEITAPVEMLSGMIKQFPTGNITLNSQAQVTKPPSEDEQPTKTCYITLSDADGKYEIRGIPAEEFPPIATIKAAPVSLPTNMLREGLKGVLYAISPDETKRILTGVSIQIGQKALKFIATDGHRVAIVEVSTEGISLID